MSSILSIVYLVVLAGCAAAALLTAVIFLAKKKTGVFLVLYAVCVVALLGVGFLVSVGNPVPNPRYTEAEPITVSPGSQNPPVPWAIAPETAPVEIDTADAPDNPTPEPEPIAEIVEEIPTESLAGKTAAPLRTKRSAAAPASASPTVQEAEQEEQEESSPIPVPAAEQKPTPEPVPMTLSAYEPMLGDEPAYIPMSNPELGGDPELADMPNPELWDDGVRQSAADS